jgi:L-ascorbate metabolism protein UlaG (beta-lactamase superfamily)
VILLDSYVNRPEVVPGRTPFVVEDLVALRPEAIFLGHGHFDHADNAAFIAKNLNIPIYASPETCDAMQNDAVRMFGAGSTVTCMPVVSRGSVPGAEVVRLPQLEPLACIVAFKHIHSGSVPYDPTYPKVTIDNVADARDATMYPAGTRHSFATVAGTGGPISLMYQFVLRSGYNFNFVWHNTTGPLKEGVGSDPGLPSPVVGQRLFDIMGSLPRTDIEFGSVVSLGFTNNGERDVVMYNQALRSQVYVPGHVTDVALPSSSPEWRLGWIRQNDAMGVPQAQRPEIRHWLVDPLDYLRPLVYTPGDPRWFDPAKAARVQAMCG